MNKRIVIINGTAQVGKDTFIRYAMEYLTNMGQKCIELDSVAKVKVYGARLGWDGHKDSKGRRFLSDLKALSDRYDGTTLYLREEIEATDATVIFTHVREGDNIDKLKNLYPSLTTVLLERDDVVLYTNTSDSDVGDYIYDYHVENNGTLEQLQESAEFLMNEISKGE